MEGKLKILSESKLTAIISFTCEGKFDMEATVKLVVVQH